MSLINVSDYGNVTGLASGMRVANEFTGGLMGPFFLMALGLIMFIILLRFASPGTAFGVPALICSVLAVFFWAAGVMAGPAVIFFFVAGIGGLFLIRP